MALARSSSEAKWALRPWVPSAGGRGPFGLSGQGSHPGHLPVPPGGGSGGPATTVCAARAHLCVTPGRATCFPQRRRRTGWPPSGGGAPPTRPPRPRGPGGRLFVPPLLPSRGALPGQVYSRPQAAGAHVLRTGGFVSRHRQLVARLALQASPAELRCPSGRGRSGTRALQPLWAAGGLAVLAGLGWRPTGTRCFTRLARHLEWGATPSARCRPAALGARPRGLSAGSA